MVVPRQLVTIEGQIGEPIVLKSPWKGTRQGLGNEAVSGALSLLPNGRYWGMSSYFLKLLTAWCGVASIKSGAGLRNLIARARRFLKLSKIAVGTMDFVPPSFPPKKERF